mgnify:CR=1 FL=1
MSYYPILSAPHCNGKTTLYNFSPNNWERAVRCRKIINLTYVDGDKWHSKVLGDLDYGGFKEFSYEDVAKFIPDGALPLLSLTIEELPISSKSLPVLKPNHTVTPMERATLSLESIGMSTSYQGEINPFPPQASLLTFAPFLQFGEKVENYALLMNLEQKPKYRRADVEIFDARTKELRKVQSVCCNQINVISLNDLGFEESSLPVITCKDMAFIPLYFSSSEDAKFLSLEHTHPPSSFVVHGNRFSAQKLLKKYWFTRLAK